MVTLDWIVLIICLTGILYCALTMPRPMILTQEQWLKLPEEESQMNDSDKA
ncbi:MAG: hypothetical protein WDZ91_02130 [Paenibacillaceae bacterium]